MSDLVIFAKRRPGIFPWDVSARQTWKAVMLDDIALTASLACPHGHYGTIHDHSIAADGTVTPSVKCPAEGCDFHAMVKLDGWDPAWRPKDRG